MRMRPEERPDLAVRPSYRDYPAKMPKIRTFGPAWVVRACALMARVPIEPREIAPPGRRPQGGPRPDFPPLWGTPLRGAQKGFAAMADRRSRKDHERDDDVFGRADAPRFSLHRHRRDGRH